MRRQIPTQGTPGAMCWCSVCVVLTLGYCHIKILLNIWEKILSCKQNLICKPIDTGTQLVGRVGVGAGLLGSSPRKF